MQDLTSRRDSLQTLIKQQEAELISVEEAQKNPAIRDHQSWLDEERFLEAIRDARQSIKESLLEAINSIDTGDLTIELHTSTLGHDEELRRVWEINQGIKVVIDEIKQQVEEKFEDIRQETQNAAPKWIAGFREHKSEFAEASKKLGNVIVNTLQSQLERNKLAFEKLQKQIRVENSRVVNKNNLLVERNGILNQIESECQRMSYKRDRHAKKMSETLNRRVQISVKGNGNKYSYINWLSTNLDGRSVKKHHIEKIVRAHTPRQLASIIREGNDTRLLEETDISEAATTSIFMAFKQNTRLIYELEHIVPEDLPDIRMKLKDGTYRKLDELSTGQKFTVIILLALTEDDKPIIYDQPEDALEAALIFSDIAQLLRKAKDTRQFIFATHNPNMSVAADLDLAIVVSGSATEATVDMTGGIEDANIRDSLIEYLEGGSEAMEQRIGKYES